jgi:simple sugar transport system ATP-binding protein
VGEAQRVEILKTLYRGAKILILDEPTAVLSPPEIDELWQVLRGMRERGETIVLITHKLDEVMEISDTITVMRQGQTIAQLTTSEDDTGRDRKSDGRPRRPARDALRRDVAARGDHLGAAPRGARSRRRWSAPRGRGERRELRDRTRRNTRRRGRRG